MAVTLDRARALLDQPPPEVPAGQLAVPDGPRIGSVCTGYGGLDAAVQQAFGGSLAWVSDIDPGASAILAHHHPGVPNLGDLTAANWASVEPVDIVCGGYPCQPFSTAGQRKGTADARHIWPDIARALGVLRPKIAVFENVANHLRIGFSAVLADLADLGFDAEWCVVRADEVGAPHRRARLFLLAVAQDADGEPRNQRRLPAPGQAESRRSRADARGRGGAPSADTSGPRLEGGGLRGPVAECRVAAADAPGLGHGHAGPAGVGGVPAAAVASGTSTASDSAGGRLQGSPTSDGPEPPQPSTDVDRSGVLGCAAAHAASVGRGEGRPEPAGQQGGSHAAVGGAPDWGRYAPAVARWEAATGRRAPGAVDVRGRLTPAFVEWLMGLPEGHVTAVPGITRNQQLKALGKGVVPQQAAAALRLLLERSGAAR